VDYGSLDSPCDPYHSYNICKFYTFILALIPLSTNKKTYSFQTKDTFTAKNSSLEPLSLIFIPSSPSPPCQVHVKGSFTLVFQILPLFVVVALSFTVFYQSLSLYYQSDPYSSTNPQRS